MTRTPANTGKLLGTKPERQCKLAFGQLRDVIRRNLKKIVVDTLDAKSGPVVDAGMILFCGLAQTGPVPLYISRITGIDRKRVVRFCWEARRAGIIGHGGTYANPWVAEDPFEANINFVLDAMVVAGEINYEGPRGPKRLYKAKP